LATGASVTTRERTYIGKSTRSNGGMFGKSIEVNNWFTNGASKAVAATPSIFVKACSNPAAVTA
jgi:hypothetical protein